MKATPAASISSIHCTRTATSASWETVAARVAELHEELGFSHFMLVLGFLGNLSQEHVHTTVE